MGGAISLLLSWLSDTVRTRNIPLKISKHLHSHNGGMGRGGGDLEKWNPEMQRGTGLTQSPQPGQVRYQPNEPPGVKAAGLVSNVTLKGRATLRRA